MTAMRKKFQGEVVSANMKSTAVVRVVSFAVHPKYLKRIKKVKQFLVDNPQDAYKPGDKVIIEETRPISKMKRFRIRGKI